MSLWHSRQLALIFRLLSASERDHGTWTWWHPLQLTSEASWALPCQWAAASALWQLMQPSLAWWASGDSKAKAGAAKAARTRIMNGSLDLIGVFFPWRMGGRDSVVSSSRPPVIDTM